jgi:hypothetical protein
LAQLIGQINDVFKSFYGKGLNPFFPFPAQARINVYFFPNFFAESGSLTKIKLST